MYNITRAETYFLTKQGKQVNIEIEDYTIKEVDGINVMNYRNGKTIGSHFKQELELLKLLKKMVRIEFYNNFIVVNGKTFNGWTRAMVDNLTMRLYKPSATRIIDIKEFDFED